MEIQIDTTDDITVAILRGEVNGRTAPDIQLQLIPTLQPESKVLLDLHGVSYMSSAGLRMLLNFYRQAQTQNSQIVLVGLTEMVRDTMMITGFLEFFEVYPSVEEGIDALKQKS